MKKIILTLCALMMLAGCTSKPSSDDAVKALTSYQADVVVIGAGGAGMAAAIEASDQGASVVILEKMSYIGGNTLRSEGGMNASETIYQKNKGIEDSVELMIEDTMKGGKGINNEELVTFFAQNSAPTIDWLTSIGMDVSDVAQGAGASAARMHRPQDGSKIGSVLVPVLKDNLAKRNITVLTETKVISIIKDEGKVTKVVALDKSGKEIVFDANAIIIATGGFGANEEMYVQYREDLAGFATTNHPGATGDGITLAQEIGADVVDMKEIQTNPTVEITSNTVISESVRGKGSILVNVHGKRFISEMETRDVLSSAILEQDDKIAYLVFDQRVMDSMAALKENYEKGIIIKGKDLNDLAAQLSLDASTLELTLNDWNKAVAAKNDTAFGRTTGMDADLSQAPYYAITVSPAVHYTMGGIKVNTNTEVIDTAGQIIKGLYAAGEVTGGLHGANRLGGNAVGDIMVFGRQAGSKAAQYAKTLSAKELVLPQKEMPTQAKGNYQDGEYEGSGQGLNGEIKLKVVVTDGSITDIDVIATNDTESLFNDALAKIKEEVMISQKLEADNVTGATYSSKGILEALNEALK
ncbi:MAG: flavocytochrome c [Erysipelotrichaceae bacterium]|nr:flavocytochrome c [Erysipelotrichaceae bacterium]MDY5252334.1 flavocytochrome c [Erysipelotrichaceae bacterium]